MRHNRLRTRLVWLAASVLLLAGSALALPPTGNPADEYGLRIARLKYGGGGDWYSDPSIDP